MWHRRHKLKKPKWYTARGDVSSVDPSDRRGGIGSLWSVKERARGTWVWGLKMEPERRREPREEVLQEEPGTKGISAGDAAKQVAHQSSCEMGWEFLTNSWSWHSDLFLYPVVPRWEAESRVLKYGCLLFILSLCVLPVGMWLWLVTDRCSKDKIDVKM